MKTIHCTVIAIAVYSNCEKAASWCTTSITQLNHKAAVLRSSKRDDTSDASADPISKILDNAPSSASFGVSYIGGDPCGSKYNDDPFDAHETDVGKPGMPEEMKDRIAAMAAEMLKRKQQKEDDEKSD